MLTSGVGASAGGDDGDGAEDTMDGTSNAYRTLLRNMFEVKPCLLTGWDAVCN